MARSDIGIIVLAAGGSSRLGRPKQLLEFEGKTLLRRAVETALESELGPVIVVLGAAFDEVQKTIGDLSSDVIHNADWSTGMSSSVLAGLELLESTSPSISAAIFMLCDQPLVSRETLQRMADVYAEANARIVASEYNNTLGVPALFDRIWFDELRSLSGDKGAKSIINRHLNDVAKLYAPESGIDIDTIADYEKLTAKRKETTEAVPN
jgi:molybdenum cofactor cytidylyltransferase